MDTNRRSTGSEPLPVPTRSAASGPLALVARLKTWPAYILAACCPGAGHLYAQQWARGVSWAVLYGISVVFLSSGLLLADGPITDLFVITAVRIDGITFADIAVPLAIVVLNVIDLYALAALERRSGTA